MWAVELELLMAYYENTISRFFCLAFSLFRYTMKISQKGKWKSREQNFFALLTMNKHCLSDDVNSIIIDK